MYAVGDFCVIPMGVGVSVAPYIAICQQVFEAAGLTYKLHAYGTNVEGDWDRVMQALKTCHEKIHEAGAPRVSSTVKIGTRTDKNQSIDSKIKSVRDLKDV